MFEQMGTILYPLVKKKMALQRKMSNFKQDAKLGQFLGVLTPGSVQGSFGS
jgi:hypothetical protein